MAGAVDIYTKLRSRLTVNPTPRERRTSKIGTWSPSRTGGGWTPTTPEEIIGQAWLDRGRGLISEAEFQAALLRAQRMKALPHPSAAETSAYG
jgi:hypothetical protein